MPLPEEHKENWYEWRVHSWGTKWDVDNDEHGVLPDISDPTECTYDFETAWSPPEQLFKNIASNFPGIRFELGWYEEQMYYGGLLIIEDGIITGDKYYQDDEFYEWAENYFGMDFRPDVDEGEEE